MKTNWLTKKLKDVCSINGGDPAPQDYAVFSSDGIPFVRMQDLGRYHVTDNLTETRDKIKLEAIKKLGVKIFSKGSIILPRSGSVFANHRAILGIDAVVVSHIAILNNYKDIQPKYLFWYLTKLDIGRYAVKTSNVDSISFQRLGKFEIPVPPLLIQKKIVERLDKIAEARKLNDDLIQKSDELFQSLLHQELNPAGKDWGVKKLREVCEINPSKVEIKKLSATTVVSFLAMADVSESAEIINKQERKLNEVKNGFTFFKDGDILVAKITPCFENGKGAFVENMMNGVGFGSTEFHVLRANHEVLLNKLLYYLVSDKKFRKIGAKFLTGSAGQQRVPIHYLENLKIPLPPLKNQKQIVARLSAVQEYKTQLLVQRAKLKELFDSVLTKSMSGEYEKSKFTPLDTKLSNGAQRPH